jgi:hypothetical protein
MDSVNYIVKEMKIIRIMIFISLGCLIVPSAHAQNLPKEDFLGVAEGDAARDASMDLVVVASQCGREREYIYDAQAVSCCGTGRCQHRMRQ